MILREHCDLSGLVTGAIFSECLRYRYRLWRRWDRELPTINFLMLNPSTADEVSNDPTVERCQRRAIRLGYGRLLVTNIFAFRSTLPAVLRQCGDPIGEENDRYIVEAARESQTVVAAWGSHGGLLDRGEAVIRLLGAAGVALQCLRKTKGNHPEHPLYIPYEVEPQLF